MISVLGICTIAKKTSSPSMLQTQLLELPTVSLPRGICATRNRSGVNQRSNRAKGFTLIEVMLTILIIGLGAMIVVLNLPSTARFDEDVNSNAERFLQQVHHAREQALLRNYVYGIEFDETESTYRFYRWYENKWQLQTDAPLRPVNLSEPYYFELEMGDFRLLDNMSEGRDAIFGRDERPEDPDKRIPRPTVLIFESTEFVPFRIYFHNRQAMETAVTVNGRSGIQLKLEEGPQW